MSGTWRRVYAVCMRNYFQPYLPEKMVYGSCHRSCWPILWYGNRFMHFKIRWIDVHKIQICRDCFQVRISSIFSLTRSNAISFKTEYDMTLDARSLTQTLHSKLVALIKLGWRCYGSSVYILDHWICRKISVLEIGCLLYIFSWLISET